MNEKSYHMKDIMDKYKISRDMIKYYEKKGLICPKRNLSGYRLYTEADMQRIKMILDVRDLGLAIDDVESQISPKGLEEVLQYIEKKREEKEKEIIKLNRQIKKIGSYEQWIVDNKLYKDSFRICYDFEMCIGCERIKTEEIECFYVRDMQVLHMSEEMKLEIKEEKAAVLTKEAKYLDRVCDDCSAGEIVRFPKLYRGSWCYSDNGELELFLKDTYNKAVELGYELCRTVYCLKRFTNRNGLHELFLDIFIPFVD